MFSFSEELKWYEPGLEVIEDSLSGNTQKDLVELIQTILNVQRNALKEAEEKETQNPDQIMLSEMEEKPIADLDAEPGDDEE